VKTSNLLVKPWKWTRDGGDKVDDDEDDGKWRELPFTHLRLALADMSLVHYHGGYGARGNEGICGVCAAG
jgi:hypothetical protein